MNSLSSELDCNLNDVESHAACDCYVFKNVIKDAGLVKSLASEVSSLSFSQRANDLHCLSQTEDFSEIKELPNLTMKFAQTMRSQVRKVVENIFNVETQDKMTMTGSIYNKGDYLLCHDDLYSDRLIAFVFYLSENWTVTDGGLLRFFAYNEDGPISENYLNNFVPVFNSLLIFRVSDHSFHEVQEIFGDNARLSINGWFHGLKPLKKQKSKYLKAPFMEFTDYISEDVSAEIMQLEYQRSNTRQHLQTELKSNLVVLAANFLTEDVCKASLTELQKVSHWQIKGSPMYRKYEALEIHLDNNKLLVPESMPNVERIVNFLISQYWQIYLNDVTGLEFAVLNEACVPPVCMIEIQKWKEGSYSVVTDNNVLQSTPTIEVTAFLQVDEDVVNDHSAASPPYSGCVVQSYGRKFNKKTYQRFFAKKYQVPKVIWKLKSASEKLLNLYHKQSQQNAKEDSSKKKFRRVKRKKLEKNLTKLYTYLERRRTNVQRKLMRIKQYRNEMPQENNVIVPKTNSLLIALNSHNTSLFTSYIRHRSCPDQEIPKTCIYCISVTYLVTSNPGP